MTSFENFQRRRRETRKKWGSPWRYLPWAIRRGNGAYILAMLLHVRVPDGRGFFGFDKSGARWCWPWQWAWLYYQARKKQENWGGQ